jgi:MtN3 and saliva related transmembrane protein
LRGQDKTGDANTFEGAGMGIADIIGGAAAVLTTISFIPQALHVLRTRDTGAISLTMYALFTTGVTLWGVYGVLTLQWPIIIANIVTASLAALILVMKLKDVLAARRSSP